MHAVLDAADPMLDFSTTDRIAILMSSFDTGGCAERIPTAEGTRALVMARFEVTQQMHELGHASLDEGYRLMRIPHAGFVSCLPGLLFPVDLEDFAASGCTISSGGPDCGPMVSKPASGDSVHYTALHKERMGYLSSDRVAVEAPTNAWKEITIHNVAAPSGAGTQQLLRVPLGVFGYSYYVEYRNEVFRDGWPFQGVIVRLASPERSASWVDSYTAAVPVILSENDAFDDPNHDVRIIVRTVDADSALIWLRKSSAP